MSDLCSSPATTTPCLFQEPQGPACKPTHTHSGLQEITTSQRIWREGGTSRRQPPYPCPLFHRHLQLRPPPWWWRRWRQRRCPWQWGHWWRGQGLVGGSACLVPLRLLVQLVEVAAGPTTHLATAPGAALWPYRSGYVWQGPAACSEGQEPASIPSVRCQGARDHGCRPLVPADAEARAPGGPWSRSYGCSIAELGL